MSSLSVALVQVSALSASSVLARQHLGGPVRPPVGDNQPRSAGHRITDDARRAPADELGVNDAQRLGRCRLTRRLRPARAAAPLGAVLGWSDQARHAPPATADQLPAVLHVVRPSLRHRVSGGSGVRLPQRAADRLGDT